MVAEGFQFMTHKAGGDKDDAELAAWWSALKPYRSQVFLGAYWVLYPGNPAGRADAFLARLDSQCPGWRDGPFILQLDCEIWNEDQDTQPDLMEIRTACNRLKAKMPKLTPIVYASQGQYGASLAGLGYPLWNARYPVSAVSTASGIYGLAGGDSGKGWGAYSGQTPAIWQFTSSATALGQTTCDANAFRGDLDQLTALVAPGWSNDVATQDDIKAALNDFFVRGYQDTEKTQRTSRIGEDALNQGIPNAFRNAKTSAWAFLGDLAQAIIAQEQAVADLTAKVDALSAQQLPADLAEQIADIIANRLKD